MKKRKSQSLMGLAFFSFIFAVKFFEPLYWNMIFRLFLSLSIATNIACTFEKDKKQFVSEKSLQIIYDAFQRRDIVGSFILYDYDNDTSVIYNVERAKKAFLPASTFKILNSLIALECGVVIDEDEVILWDGVERSIPVWNQNHTMKTAIKYSVVWFYQELARRIGEERMQLWVDSVGYGNQLISEQIDNFWLVGDLRITPIDQVKFLKKLIEEDLPFRKNHIQTVKDILIEDEGERYVFRAKTGWADYGVPVGWYIGYIEFDGRTFIFVNNIEIKNNEDARARKEIMKEIFNEVFYIDLNI